MSKNRIEIFCDGGARGNPGPAASAFVVFEDKKRVAAGGEFLGTATNNIAEYTAVLLAVSWLVRENPPKPILFYLDSELIVKQFTGEYRVKNQNLLSIYLEINQLIKKVDGNIVFKHIPRNLNKDADRLVNEILDNSTSPNAS